MNHNHDGDHCNFGPNEYDPNYNGEGECDHPDCMADRATAYHLIRAIHKWADEKANEALGINKHEATTKFFERRYGTPESLLRSAVYSAIERARSRENDQEYLNLIMLGVIFEARYQWLKEHAGEVAAEEKAKQEVTAKEVAELEKLFLDDVKTPNLSILPTSPDPYVEAVREPLTEIPQPKPKPQDNEWDYIS